MPQHEVAKGKGQRENFLAIPMTLLSFVAKKPSPSNPSGAGASVFITGLLSDIWLI
jgi:hypothetical protein